MGAFGSSVDITDIGKLIADGENLNTTGSEFSSEIAKIYGYVDELGKIWQGQSSERYIENINKFKEEFEEFAKLVNSFGDLINSVGKDYQELENNL